LLKNQLRILPFISSEIVHDSQLTPHSLTSNLQNGINSHYFMKERILKTLRMITTVPYREERQRLQELDKSVTDLDNAWHEFGGPTGKDVNIEQIGNLLNLTCIVRVQFATARLRGVKNRILLNFIIPNPLTSHLIEDPFIRNQQLEEERHFIKRSVAMTNLGTQEGKLEACVFFAETRANLQQIQLEKKERIITACSTAIDLLMSENSEVAL